MEQDVSISEYSRNKKIHAVHTVYYRNDDFLKNDCYMLLYTAYGKGVLETKDESIPLNDGTVVLIAPNTPFHPAAEKGIIRIEAYCCMFDTETIEKTWKNMRTSFPQYRGFFLGTEKCIAVSDTENRVVRNTLIRMINETMNAQAGSGDVISALLPILLVRFFRCGIKDAADNGVFRNYNVDRAIRYINEKIYSKLSLKEISEYINVSESMLCRAFRKYIGITPAQYIINLRIEKIKDALKNTDRPIRLVSELFYYQPEYTRRLFKRETGMSMAEYRNKHHYRNTSRTDDDTEAANNM